MKTVLIISPYFPPINAADMHRVRMMLPWFRQNGWRPVVFAVNPTQTEFSSDPLLLKSVPSDVEIHLVKALPVKLTRKIGLGAIALRSLPGYFIKAGSWIKTHRPDLIFFSTTQFPLLILSSYWSKRFKIPSVFDIQDPWVNTYYESLPAHQKPPKYWFSSRLNRFLEPIAMKYCAGLVAVSKAYIDDLQNRYSHLKGIPAIVMPFPGSTTDIEIARELPPISRPTNKFLFRYVGRGGNDMHFSVRLFYEAIQMGLSRHPELFSHILVQWIGTSYAPTGKGKPSLKPLAESFGIDFMVEEIPDRVPFFTGIRLLLDSDFLVIPGSDDPRYTASKLYPYLLTERQLIAIFQETSNAIPVLQTVSPQSLISVSKSVSHHHLVGNIFNRLVRLLENPQGLTAHREKMKPLLSETMTKHLCDFFNKVISDN